MSSERHFMECLQEKDARILKREFPVERGTSWNKHFEQMNVG